MNKWDRRFLDMARLVAGWSKDPSTKVGAVIADPHNRVVSVGYNGFPRGVPDDEAQLADRDMRLSLTLHAERNAILFARRDLTGCTLYCTHHPCASCAAEIIQAGIGRVVWLPQEGGFATRWALDFPRARMAFRGADVQFEQH